MQYNTIRDIHLTCDLTTRLQDKTVARGEGGLFMQPWQKVKDMMIQEHDDTNSLTYESHSYCKSQSYGRIITAWHMAVY